MDGRNITKAAALAAALVLVVTTPAAAGTPSATARHDLLGRRALPAGWTRLPTVGSGIGQALSPRQVAACAGVAARSIPPHPPKATSPEYVEQGAQTSVTEGVVLYPTLAAARAAFRALAAPHAAACAATYLNNHAAAAGTGTYAVTRLALTTPVGASCGLDIALSVTLHGSAVTADEDEVVVEVGRTEATLSLASIGSPFPLPLAQRLATSAARRLG